MNLNALLLYLAALMLVVELRTLSIRYERDDTSNQKEGQSAMKIFKVVPAKEKESGF
jgi:hypothetical protein